NDDGDVNLAGNWIGTDVTGVKRVGNDTGVDVEHGGAGTLILNNVISGNFDGINFFNAGGASVGGNLIGTDATGEHALGNLVGVVMNGASAPVVLGSPGRANVISGNRIGISLDTVTSTNSSAVSIESNLIGTDAAGVAA